MKINQNRLWERIHQLGKIGQNAQGGVTRLAFTEEERQAKDLIKQHMKSANLEIREDQLGNLFGKRRGTNPNAKTILIGSHIDTVYNGGKFDGAAGVLAGVEVLQTLSEQGVELDHSVEVVAFTDEEGARFSSGMTGSQAFIGQLTIDALQNHIDQAGHSIADAMKRQGYQPTQLATVKADPDQIKCYLELHIEQGKVLEANDIAVGLVTGIVGLRWLKVKLVGEAGHAGTTPMSLRKDPLVCASKLIQYITELAQKQKQTVATVGQMTVKPGGINVIPNEVTFTVDLRDLSDQLLDQLVDQIQAQIMKVTTEQNIDAVVEVLDRSPAVQTSENVNRAISAAIEQSGLELIKLPSGAGHDAMVVAELTDIGMVFVRTRHGLSHHPDEWAEPEDLAVGAQVLLDTVIYLAGSN
ncbi:M20 family metallo-hydrolase [Amphibacillus sediminis]|uniref:M20 family metallo-hydrolase n=1 Tax=Amphibacillus sediminis TaxID=360185 RepID=UPI00082FBB27|nr:M20 family metallo-hydrolase [Amphibacillus sediminis]